MHSCGNFVFSILENADDVFNANNIIVAYKHMIICLPSTNIENKIFKSQQDILRLIKFIIFYPQNL